MKVFFFVYLGLIVRIGELSLVFQGVLLSFLLLAMRSLAVFSSTVRSELSSEGGPMILIYGRGLAAAVLSVFPAQYGLPHADLYPSLTLFVILITALITGFGSMRAKRAAAPTQATWPS